MTFSGACLCRAVRFTITPPTKWCGHCHCVLCQKAHGAGVVTWVGVEERLFQLIDPEERLVWYQSTPGARRGFCATCGTTLFFQGERWAGEIHVVRANVEGDIDRQPNGHAYADRAVHWLTMGDDLKRYGGLHGNALMD